MDRFNLNLFFALDAILHADSLTEAARNVHLSQPAMSVSLKKLRAYFEDDLVVYQNGETRFTNLALKLKPRIRSVLQSAREALDMSLDFDPATDSRVVNLTAADVIELTFLSKVTARVVSEAPNISIISRPFSFRTVDTLFQDDLDVAIVSAAFALPDYGQMPLFDETISCMIWEGNSRIGETMTEADYFGGRHAAYFGGHQAATVFSAQGGAHPVGAALQALNRQLNIAVGASVYSALPHMIIGTDLIVTTLTRFAHRCAETMPIRVVRPPIETPVIPFVAQWQSYRSDEPVIQWLLQQLSEAAAEM